MTALTDIFQEPQLQSILAHQTVVLKQHEVNAFNIFSVSQRGIQLENFHSDILAALVDPHGPHGEGSKYLILFLEFLKRLYSLYIDLSDYGHVWVDTETMGRIDVGIFDSFSHKCVLIENKINDAPDMPDQLIRYYNRCVKEGYTVDAMIYLSLDGVKLAPTGTDEQALVTRNIAAFANSDGDLVAGWLIYCKEHSEHEDSKSFIHQYMKLLKYLNYKAMERSVQQDFYQFISNTENLSKLNQAVTLLNNIDSYRRDEFQRKISNHAPFGHCFSLRSWGNCATLFQYYNRNGNSFKMDVFFVESTSAWIRIWTPDNDTKNGLEAVQRLVGEIDLMGDFEEEPRPGESSMMRRMFKVKDYGTVVAVDNAVLAYVNNILERLRKITKQQL